MSVEEYILIAAEKRALAAAKIPEAWRLPTETLAEISSSASVMHVPRTCGLLSATELEITEQYSACQLRQKIAEGKYSAVQTTEAFCKRAAIAQQLVCRSLIRPKKTR